MVIRLEYFEYTYLQSDIHCFKWLSKSEEAHNEYFDFITSTYRSVTDNQHIIRILHDYRSTPFLPPDSIFSKTRKLQSEFPNLNRKIAYLLDDDMSAILVETLTRTLGRFGTRRYFTADQEQDAIEWLLSAHH